MHDDKYNGTNQTLDQDDLDTNGMMMLAPLQSNMFYNMIN